MRKLKIFAVAVPLFALSVLTPLVAQEYGRPQDGFVSGQYRGQYSGQYSGQYNGRVDGRASHNEGLPPSAADKYNRTYENPVSVSDCVEVDSFAPSARPGWQARVRSACQ
jgi:hypothetical protein